MISVALALSELFSALELMRIPYAVGGSFASGAWGHARQTNDLDIVIALVADQIDSLVATLEPNFGIDSREVRGAAASAETYRTFQLFHWQTSFKVDVFISHLGDYDYVALRRAKTLEILPDTFGRCFSAEDVVIGKLRWYELGNRQSDRQWNDIVQVLEIQRPQIDLAYLRNWATHFEVGELLEDALSQTLRD